MPRHPNTPLIVTVIGALLLSVFLCFTPVGGAGHHHSVDSGAVTTTALSLDAERAEDRLPQHRHHNHSADCTSPGLASHTYLATRHVPDAITLAASFGDIPTAPSSEARTAPGDRVPIARSGRSTQIRVCRWRI
ncbi:hypothetical protein I3F58_19730 [Streptomyces sp. MUM 203J]|uniref:hypothetical protein n=1 Tax=Streptomyces sp. MUM 203J TaxID=2791990 RepID=UPI001F042D97|nr:hypothetical protein [Streptomyces sp. MUM 203J]MCH0541755.1 hypothetical protein [Streptomyces sp. MUM 203J]